MFIPKKTCCNNKSSMKTNNRRCANLVLRATHSNPPSKKTLEVLKKAIDHANEICRDHTKTNQECIVAWDIVADVSKGFYQQRDKENEEQSKEPLEKYCEEFPEADECRIYDN